MELTDLDHEHVPWSDCVCDHPLLAYETAKICYCVLLWLQMASQYFLYWFYFMGFCSDVIGNFNGTISNMKQYNSSNYLSLVSSQIAATKIKMATNILGVLFNWIKTEEYLECVHYVKLQHYVTAVQRLTHLHPRSPQTSVYLLKQEMVTQHSSVKTSTLALSWQNNYYNQPM